MSSEWNRRFFIRQVLATLGAAAVPAVLSGCSTIDEYIFEDHYNLKDQVLIIGGGLSGLHLAYLLKKNKTEFRLFEGSTRFGGRIRSLQGYDLGGSIYQADHVALQTLLKEFHLSSENIDKNNFYLAGGMDILIEQLVQRVSGLIPYRNMRLQWRLISVRKVNSAFELVFETPKGRRTYVSKRVVLAIPPSQWAGIAGLLDLDEMQHLKTWMSSLKSENIVKAVIPYSNVSRPVFPRGVLYFDDAIFDVRQVNKKNKTSSWSEVDFQFRQAGRSIEIQKLHDFMKRKMNIGANQIKPGTENFFDWKSSHLIGAAYFKSDTPWPEIKSSQFQVIGDFAHVQYASTMNGAVSSALRAAEMIS